jgi:DNA-directed RNA polymerase specialized sigma24 family protein
MDREQAAAVVDELFDVWYAQLLRYAIRLVRQKSTAEEVVQDTFLDFYKTLRAGSEVQYPKAWTMCVVRRKIFERRQEPFGIDQEHEALDGAVDLTADWSDVKTQLFFDLAPEFVAAKCVGQTAQPSPQPRTPLI